MKENKYIIISILFVALIIGGALYFSDERSLSDRAVNYEEVFDDGLDLPNVSVVAGKQIIEIRAKGGFRPAHTVAKAGMQTILRVDTNGTFDCTSVVSIPSLKIRENLPMSGVTDIPLGIQKVGTIDGTCGMGMYPFDIRFE